MTAMKLFAAGVAGPGLLKLGNSASVVCSGVTWLTVCV